MNGCISVDRILNKLDEYLNKNDYASAEKIELYKKKLIAYGFEGKFGTFHVYENKEWFKRIINRIKL